MAMPGFPGAAKSLSNPADCANFQASACSRPPDPSSRTFMAIFPSSDSFDAAGRLLAEEAFGDNAPALSVSELSLSLKRMVEDNFGYVRLRGEISGYKRAASGHLYLTLKDDRACIDAVMWKGGAASLAFNP